MVKGVKLIPCIAWTGQMKRTRDIQGKFTLKNQDYRQVRSLRLTDSTWKALGIAAECLGITRADWLENLVRQNRGNLTRSPKNKQLSPLFAARARQQTLEFKEQYAARAGIEGTMSCDRFFPLHILADLSTASTEPAL